MKAIYRSTGFLTSLWGGGKRSQKTAVSRKGGTGTISKDIHMSLLKKKKKKFINNSTIQEKRILKIIFLEATSCVLFHSVARYSIKQISQTNLSVTTMIYFNLCVFWKCRCLGLLGAVDSCSSVCSFYLDLPVGEVLLIWGNSFPTEFAQEWIPCAPIMSAPSWRVFQQIHCAFTILC